jgi:L-ascorbate metabolism protein UlaG (beta-lactamase superfamily)
MDIHDAVKAAKLLNCNHIIGMHFDTFPYIKIKHSTAEQAFEKENIKLTLLQINEALDI